MFSAFIPLFLGLDEPPPGDLPEKKGGARCDDNGIALDSAPLLFRLSPHLEPNPFHRRGRGCLITGRTAALAACVASARDDFGEGVLQAVC